jgi:hypothetical protein
VSDDEAIEEAARAFLTAALPLLERRHVIPTSVYHPYLRLGRDYFGDDLVGLKELGTLESLIAASHPRFSEPVVPATTEIDPPSTYVFTFLEACISRLGLAGAKLRPTGAAVDESMSELLAAIRSERCEVACCREVAHLTTLDREPLSVDGLEVVPLVASAAGHRSDANRLIESIVPGAWGAYGREDLDAYGPPGALVVARAPADQPYRTLEELSARIERFLLVGRLLFSSTTASLYEVRGATSLVARVRPHLIRFRGESGLLAPTRWLRRPASLGADNLGPVSGIARLLEQVDGQRRADVLRPFETAQHRFLMSYHAHGWIDQIVDLATALEATLAGTDKQDVLLRLRFRCAALLAVDNDSAPSIFNDVGQLYDLRSRLVHGSELKDKDLRKIVYAISAVPDGALFGDALAHAVDRLRDLVRRAILMRLCLGTSNAGADPIWPLGTDVGVDAALSDDATRLQWRVGWLERLESFGASSAASRPDEAEVGVPSTKA